MAKKSHWDEMKERRQLKAAQEAEAQRISTLEKPDPERMAMQSDYVLVRRIQRDRTEGGIVLPETAQASTIADGVVVACGPGLLNAGPAGLETIPMPCKVGDEVLFDPQAPAYPMAGDRTLFATRACFVMCVLKPKPSLVTE